MPLAVVLVVALLTSCTGGSGAAPVTMDGIRDAVQVVVGGWGDRDGFALVLLVADAGYSIDQIVEHPALLRPSGEIVNLHPAAEQQALATAGLALAMAPTSADPGSAHAAAEDPQPAEAFLETFEATLEEVWEAGQRHLDELAREERLDDAVTFATTALLARGYTPQRVIEAILFGEVTPVDTCLVIVARDGVVRPSGEDLLAGECPALTDAAPRSPDPEPTDPEPTDAGTTDAEAEPSGSPEPSAAATPVASTTFSGWVVRWARYEDEWDGTGIPDNQVDITVADGEATGRIALRSSSEVTVAVGGEPTSYEVCLFLFAELPPGAVTETGSAGLYRGETPAVLVPLESEAEGFQGPCPTAGEVPDRFAPRPAIVVLEVVGDTLTGNISVQADEEEVFGIRAVAE